MATTDPIGRAIDLGRRQPLIVFGVAAAGVAAFALLRSSPPDVVPATPDPNADAGLSNLSNLDLASSIADALNQIGIDQLLGGGGAGGDTSGPVPSPTPTPTPTPAPVLAGPWGPCGPRPGAYGPWVCTVAGWRRPADYAPTSSRGTRGRPVRPATILDGRPFVAPAPHPRLRPVPGGVSYAGSLPTRIAAVKSPTPIWYPDGSVQTTPAGSLLPIAKGTLVGDVVNVVVDGPFAGGSLVRHAPTYTTAPIR